MPPGMVMTVGWRTFEALRRRGLIEADNAEDGTWYRLTEAAEENSDAQSRMTRYLGRRR